MKNKKPFVSVVVASYNAEKKIEETIKSLINQNYPKDKYEIIVVDDCSKDNTSKIISKYPIKIIKHDKNKGLASVRNTGLKNAKGEIYVCFDDDCIADKNWLNNLIKIYLDKDKLLGVCGFIKGFKDKTLISKYLSETGMGNPIHKDFTKSKNPFIRFLAYIKERWDFNKKENIYEVGHLSGANASFYTKDLQKIRGWDNNFRLAQDTDLCERLKTNFMNKKFLCNSDSIIYHKHPSSFSKYLKKIFFKSEKTLEFYQKNNKFPPIFPFPLTTLFFSILLSYFNPLFLPLGLILLPQLFYLWWPIKFFKSFKLYYLAFSYIQFSIELATILGLIRGYLILKFSNKNEKIKSKK